MKFRPGAFRLPYVLLITIAICAAAAPCRASETSAGCNVRSALQWADSLLKEKRMEAARAELKRLSGCRGLTPLDTFRIGWFFGRVHDFQQALRLFRSVSPDVPDRATHQYAVALTLFELGDYQGTVDTLSGQAGLSAQSVNLLAVAYSKLGRYQEAYDRLTGEIEKDASDRLAYLNLITLLCDTGMTADASKVADRAVASFPKDSEMLVVRGATYTLLGEADKARSDFASAIALSPRDPSPRFLIAVTDYKKGDYQTAITELSQAIQSGIRDSDLHYLLAECLLRIDGRDVENALSELTRALELNARSVSALALRGKLLLQTHRAKEAIADLQLAHSIDPGSRSAAYNLARAYFALGRKEEAEALLKPLSGQSGDSVDELSEARLKQTISGGGASPP